MYILFIYVCFWPLFNKIQMLESFPIMILWKKPFQSQLGTISLILLLNSHVLFVV